MLFLQTIPYLGEGSGRGILPLPVKEPSELNFPPQSNRTHHMMTFLGLRPATVASPECDRASAGYLEESEVSSMLFLQTIPYLGGVGEGDSPPPCQRT